MGGLFNAALAVVVAGAVIWILWFAAQPRCVLLLTLSQGRLRVVRGKTTHSFLEAVQSICAESGIVHGEIRGVWRGRTVALSFSTSFPPDVQQRVRNVWQFHR